MFPYRIAAKLVNILNIIADCRYRKGMTHWLGYIFGVFMILARRIIFGVIAMIAAMAPHSLYAQVKPTPYWASISVSEARMRVGPSKDYPASWIYRRKGLPVKVVQVHNNWRKIEDPDGTQGWMHVRLLSATPTAILIADNGAIYEGRTKASRLIYYVEKGVVGHVRECKNGWCLFDVEGQDGFLPASILWGGTD